MKVDARPTGGERARVITLGERFHEETAEPGAAQLSGTCGAYHKRRRAVAKQAGRLRRLMPGQRAGRDFRRHHQNVACAARRYVKARDIQRHQRAEAGGVHVIGRKTESRAAEFAFHQRRRRRNRLAPDRSAEQQKVHVGELEAGFGKRCAGRRGSQPLLRFARADNVPGGHAAGRLEPARRLAEPAIDLG